MAEMTWAETMDTIEEYYRWFAVEAPGVTPKETGVLGNLWRHADNLAARGLDED